MEHQTSTAMNPREPQELSGTEATRPGRVIIPPVDIYETQDVITLLADMPGVAADDLKIDLNEGVLTITGHTRAPESTEETEVFREYLTGTFQRKFTLSETIDQARIDAKLTHGVLHLQLPKVEKAKPRKIDIKVA